MAKLGNYNIPEITLNKCINVCNIINSNKDRSMSRLELSVLINMSARGGQYSKLINSCKSWGLIDGREFYTITPLAVKVLNPANSNELIISKKELILSNSFFNQLYRKFPNIQHSETSLLQSIEEITGADRSSSIKYENLLRKILFEINPIVKSTLDLNIENNNEVDKEVTGNVLKISSPGISVEFQFNDEGLNAAINLLNSLKVSKIIN
ncbi:MAG: hypothetical protein CM15mP129_10180 [Chloroflexota bacterium]|jgi:hypothetical protein|nr:MAG: hypothetical protein CM15mP129_10180 [Chloroflexota bacterium]|tara:strand:+ start:59 stop:688 length:630 start_codon:yes stop_codon:yes gene_type:complete